MDKAKSAISDFMSKSGHHDTTVHEKVAPAVVHETIKPQRHENVTTAIDKEVHQDHYHTTVQPVHDREVLPEQHTHNIIPVEHRTHEHGDAKAVEARLTQEAAQFRDERTTHATRETHEVRPVVAGEHIHHHVHENIQPVVHKETIQPHVVHTTVPVHEVHHNAAQHHTASALPAMSMADFQKQGGVLTGREERYDGFEGEPRNIGTTLGSGSHHTSSHTGTTGAGLAGAAATGAAATHGQHSTTTGTTGTHGVSKTSSSSSSDRDAATGTKHKASLLDKINPSKDADGDGKAGFMK